MRDKIQVGLIGYGLAGRVFHAPVMQATPQLRLKKVVERRNDESRQRYPWVEVARDVQALFQDEEIELVVVATPNSSHFELAQQALLAHKHVVVDKPFTTTASRAEELIELARRQNRLISVFQNRRWDGDFLTVRKILESRLLGRLVAYESHFNRFRNARQANAWREAEGEGSGILFDLGSHLIDQALVLFGWPQMVAADIRRQRKGAQTDDYFELALHYAGLKVSLQAGMLAREPGPRFILHGTEGSFVKHGLDPQEEALKRGLTPSAPHWGEESAELWGKLNTQIAGLHIAGQVESLAGSYQAFYQNIADAIAGSAELAVKPEEARNTIRIIELARQSSAEKRALPAS